jgi:RNA polymerase sigma factor (sigma-70 family)
MTRRTDDLVLGPIRALFHLGVIGELSDGQLLERFATGRGESAELAFAALVERHGPMVLRICRNGLRDANDVEDAFQATFLVLVRRARALWVEDSLAPWLHRVARRIAGRARTNAARRRDRERRAAAGRPATAPADEGDEGLMALLQEEIDRLPERCRVPVVLCDLEGLSHQQAARRLSWPIGTVKSRLMSGRERLRARLVRRGVAPAVALMRTAPAISARAALEAVPPHLVKATVQAARRIAAGAGATIAGAVPASVALLMEGARGAMFMTRIKFIVLACGLAAGGAVLAGQQAARERAAAAVPAPKRAVAPIAEPADEPGDDDPDVRRAMDRLRLEMLESEVAKLRTEVDRALNDKVACEIEFRRGTRGQGYNAEGVAHTQEVLDQARRVYRQKVRELASLRRRLGTGSGPDRPGGEHPDPLQPLDERPAEPTEPAEPRQPAAVGSIDMDAVFKRYIKVAQAKERLDAMRNDARGRLAKLEEDAKSIQAQMQRLTPETMEYGTLEDRLAAVKQDMERHRERSNRDLERRHARDAAGLFEDIRDAVAAVARARGLDYVIKAEARPELPADADPNQVLAAVNRSVLYANPRNDITEAVIRELNRRAEAAGGKAGR